MAPSIVLAAFLLAQAPDAPASVPAEQAKAFDPGAPTSDDRARAATASGVVAFVGLTIGGVGIPGVLGLVFSAAGGLLPQEALYVAAVIGGAAGAAAGGAVGAFPTTVWYGVPLVALAGAAGACVGLIPTALIAYAAKDNPPSGFDTLNPLVLGQSATLVLAMVAGGGAAAGVGALLAAKKEPEAQ